MEVGGGTNNAHVTVFDSKVDVAAFSAAVSPTKSFDDETAHAVIWKNGEPTYHVEALRNDTIKVTTLTDYGGLAVAYSSDTNSDTVLYANDGTVIYTKQDLGLNDYHIMRITASQLNIANPFLFVVACSTFPAEGEAYNRGAGHCVYIIPMHESNGRLYLDKAGEPVTFTSKGNYSYSYHNSIYYDDPICLSDDGELAAFMFRGYSYQSGTELVIVSIAASIKTVVIMTHKLFKYNDGTENLTLLDDGGSFALCFRKDKRLLVASASDVYVTRSTRKRSYGFVLSADYFQLEEGKYIDLGQDFAGFNSDASTVITLSMSGDALKVSYSTCKVDLDAGTYTRNNESGYEMIYPNTNSDTSLYLYHGYYLKNDYVLIVSQKGKAWLLKYDSRASSEKLKYIAPNDCVKGYKNYCTEIVSGGYGIFMQEGCKPLVVFPRTTTNTAVSVSGHPAFSDYSNFIFYKRGYGFNFTVK